MLSEIPRLQNVNAEIASPVVPIPDRPEENGSQHQKDEEKRPVAACKLQQGKSHRTDLSRASEAGTTIDIKGTLSGYYSALHRAGLGRTFGFSPLGNGRSRVLSDRKQPTSYEKRPARLV